MTEREVGHLAGQMGLVLDKLEDLEKRMRALETFKWKVAGAAIVLGSSAGMLAKLLG